MIGQLGLKLAILNAVEPVAVSANITLALSWSARVIAAKLILVWAASDEILGDNFQVR